VQRITGWVLAHKRIVVAFWIALTLVGMASAGSASKALKQKFSVPGKEGWQTNQQIARDFRGTGGNSAPLVPVVTLPAGKTVSSPFSILVKVVGGKVTYLQFLEDSYATASSFRKSGSWIVQAEPGADPIEV